MAENLLSDGSEMTLAGTTQQISVKPWWYLFGLFLSTMVGGISSISIKQLLLPIQVSQLSPHATALAFTLVSSVGAVAGLVTSPMIGAFSDRTSSRWGRRRPWIMGGMSVAGIGMIIMAVAPIIPILLLGEVCAQVGIDAILAITTAVIPDQIPRGQRPFIAAAVGMAPNVGGIIGLLLVARLTTPSHIVLQGYLLIAVISLCCVLAFLLILRDPPARPDELPPRFHLRPFLVSFVRPLRQRDFALVVVSRGCAYLSFTLLGTYLLFSLQGQRMPLPLAVQNLTTFQVLSTGLLLCGALASGWLSARLRVLKPFATIGGCFMGLGLLVLVFGSGGRGFLVAAALFGFGFGLFLGIDIEMAVRVLPSAQDRGKDLAILYDTIYLALILSPIIGGVMLSVFPSGFGWIFAVAAGAALASGLLVLPVRSVA